MTLGRKLLNKAFDGKEGILCTSRLCSAHGLGLGWMKLPFLLRSAALGSGAVG